MPGAKIQPNNPANDPDLKPVKGHSRFVPNYSLYKTHTFGLYEPSYAAETVPDDQKYSYRSGFDVDTQNLKAPLMTPIKMNKDTFFVPKRAILPKNADLLITNPLTGDDVVATNVNSLFCFQSAAGGSTFSFFNTVMQYWSAAFQGYNATTLLSDHAQWMACFLYRTLHAYSYLAPLFSYGSLAQSLGYNLAAHFHGLRNSRNEAYGFDKTFDIACAYLKAKIVRFQVTLYEPVVNSATSITWNQRNLYVYMNNDKNHIQATATVITFRSLLELLAQGAIVGGVEQIEESDPNNTDVYFADATLDIPKQTLGFATENYHFANNAGSDPVYVELDRLVAYQLACASFYTDDGVDYVYTAKLWHENMLSLARLYSNNFVTNLCYLLNGVQMEYDSVSWNVFKTMLGNLPTGFLTGTITGTQSGGNVEITWGAGPQAVNGLRLEYFFNIFGYQRSLRYRDYFVGARKSPLAVGNVTVQVNQNVVDVVDVTRKIQYQRFLNQVNRIGRRIKEYSAGIFGAVPKSDPTEVIFLSHLSTNIGAEETSNTGAAQLIDAQTTTSKLRKSGSNFVFTTDFAEYGIVITICSYDAVRPICDGLDRTMLHTDRYEMFNPYLQHIGDQPATRIELNPVDNGVFGYKLRYSEYKQRTDRLAGGFKEYLPGFAFPIDVDDLANPLSSNNGKLVISPDFIRMKPHEFDKFFNSLPNCSPAGYFHFIVRHDNETSIDRPMEAAPSIL